MSMIHLIRRRLAGAVRALLCGFAFSCGAVEPGDIIINEVYFNPRDTWKTQSEAVELLVVKDGVDLNGLVLSDRDIWNKQTEEQCVLQDMGQNFLTSVRSGTLIVVNKGAGTDDTDAKDFVVQIYAKTSLFCNMAPGTNAFWFNDAADNLHVFQGDQQIDFVKFRASGGRGMADPGKLEWENGAAGSIDVGPEDESTGIKFLGNKADLNDYLAAWQPYSELAGVTNNLGEPNGGRNTTWIEGLRKPAEKTTVKSP